MARKLSIRLPSDDLIERYRAMGLWTERTLTDWLDEGLQSHAEQTFKIWSSDRPFDGTFAQLREQSLRIARGLQDMGIGPGDVVSFQLPNWIEAAEAFLATLYVGAVSLPVVHIYGAKELQFVLRQSGARAHITAERFRHLEYAETMKRLAPDLPDLEHVLYIERDFERLRSFDPLEQPVAVDIDSPAVLGYTSGTTADPKGVIHTHRTQVAEMLQRITREPGDERPLPVTPPKGFETWFVGSPIGHVSGLQIGLYVPILFGRPAHLTDRWEIETVLDTLVEANLQIGASANYFFNSVINHPHFDADLHLPQMRYILSGGAPVPRSFGEKCDAMGVKLVRGYGSTEHPSVTGAAFEDPLEKRIGTDGRALAGVEIQIRDTSGSPLPAGTAGAIYTRGPDLFAGYVDETLNAEAFDDDGWFATGDVGILDAEGFLQITDRVKDIIIRGGENISAAEVEDAVGILPQIAESAAVAAPDPRLGERVCLFVIPAKGQDVPTMQELQRHLAEYGLARQKWPEELRAIDDFERTAAGKVKKFALREMLRNEALTPSD